MLSLPRPHPPTTLCPDLRQHAAAGLLIASLLLGLAPAAHAGPAEGTVTRATAGGTYTGEVAGGAQVRDVFTVVRGSESLGEVMVISVKGSALTFLPRPSFKGAPQQGDHLVFARHASAPRDLSPPAGSGRGAAGRPPATGAGGSTGSRSTGAATAGLPSNRDQRPDIFSHPIFITASHTSAPRADGGQELVITTVIKNDSQQSFENVIVELDCAATTTETKIRNAGTVGPGQSVTHRWRRTIPVGTDSTVTAHCRYFYDGQRVDTTAVSH